MFLISEKGLGWLDCQNAAENLASALGRCGRVRWPYGRSLDQATPDPKWPTASGALQNAALALCQ